MRKVILLFLLFLSVAGVRTQGQNITFSHLTTDDGLSQFSVNSLYIDERGIIWIGTREGLNRYNGNDIKSFKLNKTIRTACSAIQCCASPETKRKGIPALYGRGGRIRSDHTKIQNVAARQCGCYLFQREIIYREKRRSICI